MCIRDSAHGDPASLSRESLSRRPANALAGRSHNCHSTLQTQIHKNRIIDGSNRSSDIFGNVGESSLRSLQKETNNPLLSWLLNVTLEESVSVEHLFQSQPRVSMANPAKYVWLDDELKDAARSGVPVVNAGLHYGFTVFEGIRCYATDNGPAVFRLVEHVDRLLDSARIVGFRDLPWTRATLIEAIHKTVAANKFSACYIRPVIYLDGAMDLVVDSGKPRLIIAVWEWTAFLGKEAKERGIRANISSFTRLHPNIMMTKAKVAGNYVSSILAKTESQRAGFDEAIMLDPQGYIAECTGENIFVVRDQAIYTPSRGAILEGITRDSLITLAQDLGHTVVEEPISRDQLYIADEVFVCGTAAEVVGLREIDFRTIGDGKTGPVTRAMQAEFEKLTSGRHARSAAWFSPVPAFEAALSQA
jgi:branched-chain amino acid aminotransferase